MKLTDEYLQTYGTDAYIRYCDYDVDFSFKSGPSEKNRYYGDADSVHPHFRDFSYKRLQNTVATALALNAPRRWTSVMGAIPAALVWDTLSECLESSMDLVATSVFVEIPTPAFDSLGLEAGVSLYELVSQAPSLVRVMLIALIGIGHHSQHYLKASGIAFRFCRALFLRLLCQHQRSRQSASGSRRATSESRLTDLAPALKADLRVLLGFRGKSQILYHAWRGAVRR